MTVRHSQDPIPIHLLIAGAAKAGTTSLKAYIGQHPQVCTHHERGINFFDDDSEWNGGYNQFFDRYFGHCATGSKLIAGKSVRLFYSEKAMGRLFEHNAEVQLVLLFRNPIDRAYSDYWYARRRGWEVRPTFEQALKEGVSVFAATAPERARCDYVERSLYARHLRRLRRVFPAEQICTLLLEDLRSDPTRVLNFVLSRFPDLDPLRAVDVSSRHNAAALPRSEYLARIQAEGQRWRWLKRLYRTAVPPHIRDPIRSRFQKINERSFRPPPMNPETREQLREMFERPNAELALLTGLDTTHWK